MKISKSLRDQIIKLLRSGKSGSEIADELNVGKMQVAGIKAHLTRNLAKKNYSQNYDKRNVIPQLLKNTPTPDKLKDLRKSHSILIGTDQIFGKKVYWNFDPKTGSVNPHILLVGETGFGKTYATQCICAELQKKAISSIIFDYGQGFGIEESSKEFFELTKPKQIDASKNGISINPLQIFSDDIMGPLNAAQRVADTFCRISSRLGIQQKEAIIDAIDKAFQSEGIIPENKLSWANRLPEFYIVHEKLKRIAKSKTHPLRKTARTAYSHIRSFFRFNIIREEGEQLTWRKMIGTDIGIWVIQLKGLEQDISLITTEMLLWNFISYLQSRGPSKIEVFIVLDEAHKLSLDNGSPVDWLLREGRKFGVGVILASQQLEDYSKVAVANTATKIIFQNPDEKQYLSKALAKKCKNLKSHHEIDNIISVLNRGQAFILSENVGRVLKIDRLESRRLITN